MISPKNVMDTSKKTDYIKELLDRIEHHIFTTDEELKMASAVRSKLAEKDNLPVAHLNHLEGTLKRIDKALISRELAPEERTKEIRAFGVGLEDLETILSLSIDKEQEAQSKTSRIFTAILLGGIAISGSIILKLAFQSQPSWIELTAQALALCASIFVLFILAKLAQSARESAERMDEKGVAIKFIRYGLKIILERPNEPHMLQAGIGMFLGHHGQQSKPIEREDFLEFTGTIKNLFKEAKSSD